MRLASTVTVPEPGLSSSPVIGSGASAGLTADEDAAAVNRVGLGEGLVEDHDVVLDAAAVGQAQVADAATVALAEVAADPVLLDPVGVGARVQRDAAARAAEGAAVLGDVVVVDADPVVHRVGVVRPIRSSGQGRVADTDAAAVEAGVGGEAVVADVQELVVAVDHDAAALARADDGEAVDARAAVCRVTEAVGPVALPATKMPAPSSVAKTGAPRAGKPGSGRF